MTMEAADLVYYSDYKISRLLEEKGYDGSTCGSIDRHGNVYLICREPDRRAYPMALLSDILKWLREEYNIIISVYPECGLYTYDIYWAYEQRKDVMCLDSYEIALTMAIKDVLINFIK